jgi:plastocyanin
VVPVARGDVGSVEVGRSAWAVIVAAFLALAVAAPVQMVRANRAKASANTSAKTSAKTSAATGAKAAGAGSGSVSVKMVDISFRPSTIAVRKGTEVVFENDDVAPHTVTAVGGGPVDSGTLAPRKIFKLVINEPLEYFCQIHPQMKGKVNLTG